VDRVSADGDAGGNGDGSVKSWRFFLVSLFLLGLFSGRACGDGGSVRLSERLGNYRVTVFTSPTPVRAGPVDLSILVLDAQTGTPLTESEVRIEVIRLGTDHAVQSYKALIGSATNKLLHAVHFELPTAGTWRIDVQLSGPTGTAQTSFDFEAGDRLPRWMELWPWIALPLLPIVFFLLRAFSIEMRMRRAKAIIAMAKTCDSTEPAWENQDYHGLGN
jgi:hypothetical protein